MKTLFFNGLIKLLICLVWASPASQFRLCAQSHLIQYRPLAPSDGLASSTVNSIVQDNEGFIWLATGEGIQQYDGYRFRTFTQATHNLRAYSYMRLLNVKGRIWALKWQANYVIDIIDPATRQVQAFESVFPDAPMAPNDIANVEAGPYHSIFLTTKKGEIYHYDGRFRRFGSTGVTYQSASIFCPNDSLIWVVQGQRCCEAEDRQGAYHFTRCDTTGFSQGGVALSVPDGLFMLGKAMCFKLWGQMPKSVYPASNVDLSSYLKVAIDRQKCFWLSRKGAVDVIEPRSGRKIAVLDLKSIREKTGHEISPYTIYLTYFDLNNLAWIPTDKGVLVVSISENHFQPFLNGQNMSTRGMVAIDAHRVVAATYKGVKIIDLDKPGACTDLPAPMYNAVGVYYEAPIVWMANHEYSLLRFNLRNHRFHRYFFPREGGQFVYYSGLSCYRDRSRRFWVGTEKGLLWLDEPRDTLLEWKPFQSLFTANHGLVDVRQFVENEEGLWIVTSRGLYLKPPSADMVIAASQLTGQNLYHLHIDSEGIFWMAVRGGGIIRWDRNANIITRFTAAEGLSNNTVYAIVEDKSGHLWMSTNVGLNVFDKKNQTVQVFFTRDGLANNEFNFASHLKMPDGRMLFGGIDGIASFYPEQLKTNKSLEIPLRIWGIQRLNPVTGKTTDLLTEFEKNGSVHIPVSENNLYVEFALFDLFAPASNRYAYLLEGISPDWQYISESYLRLNSLPFGNYKLRIRGFGSTGAVSNQELVIPMVVEAPFYMKSLFWILLLYGFVVLFRLRTRQLRQAKLRLERLVEERTAHIEAQKMELEKINSTKDQIFAILGHEMRSPVMQLQDFSEKVDYLVKKGETDRLKTLSDHFGQTIANVREILENLLSWGKIQSGRQMFRPQRFELQQITNDLIRQTGNLAELKNIRFEVEEEVPLYLFADPQAIGIVLRNLLHNAIKFTPKDGKVTFTAKQTDAGNAIIEVRDSGIGMDPDLLAEIRAGKPQDSRSGTGGERGTGLGLSVCLELAAQNGVQLEFASSPANGTTVHIVFPVKSS